MGAQAFDQFCRRQRLRRGVGVDGDRRDVAGGVDLGRRDRDDTRRRSDRALEPVDGVGALSRNTGDDEQRPVEAFAEALREQLVCVVGRLA
jgi:hypothetical protein